MSPTAPSSSTKAGFGINGKICLTLLLLAVTPAFLLTASLLEWVTISQAMIGAMACQTLGALVVWFLFKPIVSQARSINQTLENINQGDFEARANRYCSGELGQAADALNAFCDNALNLQQSNHAQDQIQASIENLIAEMEEIAAGNLSLDSKVNDDMTGAISRSVNEMIQQWRAIVKGVQSSAQGVSDSVRQIEKTTALMSKQNKGQTERIKHASNQLFEINSSFQKVAEMTGESVEVAFEARQTASNGLKAVSDTIDGMQRIRDQVQSTSKRIKRLGESSQEIGEIVQLISDIADRTSILALNASIQAAMAGDAGQGFAVVAQEIEGLAEQSNDATQQVSKLIRAIQNETSEVISDMEEATREVVAGSELASQAGSTLFEIDSVSNQLMELIQASSDASQEQADSANQIAKTMAAISDSSQDAADINRKSNRHVERLTGMVNQLRQSVSQFNVSGDLEPAGDASWIELEVPEEEPAIDSNPSKSHTAKKRNRKFQKRNRGVAKTVTKEEKPEKVNETQLTEEEIDNSLWEQVREASGIIQDASQDKDDSSSSEESNPASRSVTPTIMFESES